MRIKLFLFFYFFVSIGYAQEYNNNNFFTFFDLANIKHKEFHHQIQLSTFIDEVGYSGEYFLLKKEFFSIQPGISFKRMLPNFNGWLWTPQTLEYASIFPMNGVVAKNGLKYYFDRRKFLFVGLSLYGGLFWTNENTWPEFSYPGGGYSSYNYTIYMVKNKRTGFDFLFGRKFISRFIDELVFAIGTRFDNSFIRYQCLNCYQTPSFSNPIEKNERFNMLHLTFLLTFDLKRNQFDTE